VKTKLEDLERNLAILYKE